LSHALLGLRLPLNVLDASLLDKIADQTATFADF
jgi:hypothetical protein